MKTARLPITMLFIPGTEKDKFAKIPKIQTRAFILDLEDAVPPAEKAASRKLVGQAIDEYGASARLHVRVNPADSPYLVDDLEAIIRIGLTVATILGDFGADVVKIEHPRGDDARRWGKSRDDIPLWWKVISRNKELIALDLHRTEDRATARDLCLWADVVIENFRPGRLDSWGLGYDDLAGENPGLIMVKVTGFGQTGPYSDRPGFGTLAEAFSGFAAITGAADGPPTLPPFGLADGVAALTGAYAVLAALRWRDSQPDGRGQVVDLSLYEPLFSILGPQVIEYDQLGILQKRRGNRSPRTAPRNAYRTADDHWVTLSAGTQQIADRIFAAIGRPELAEDDAERRPQALVDPREHPPGSPRASCRWPSSWSAPSGSAGSAWS